SSTHVSSRRRRSSHAMIRHASFHAAMARLALVAALLLAAVPTLGRLAPKLALATQAAHAELVALCTAQGLEYVDPAALQAGVHAHSASHAGHADHDGTPERPHDHGAPDCAYCPLLLSAGPTLGRLAPKLALATQAAHAELVALCTAQGLEYVDPAALQAGVHAHSASHAGHADHDGTPERPHDHGAPDCAYCPLLL